MSTSVFGRLEKVDLSSVWDEVAEGFAPWLGEESSLALVGEAVGLELELEPAEEGGKEGDGANATFVRCKDKVSGASVTIETQLGATDDEGLGRILVNAAGARNATVVWVAATISNTHGAVLDWLNKITGKGLNFYALEIELWRIGESNYAPNFKMVCGPNLSRPKDDDIPVADLDDNQRLQLEYWTEFVGILEGAEDAPNASKPQPQNLMTFPLGNPGFLLAAFADHDDKRLGIYLQLSGPAATTNLHQLHAQKAEIESEVISPLEWRELPEKSEGYVMIRWEDVDPADRKNWSEQHEWLRDTLVAFHRVFAPRISELDGVSHAYTELPWE